MRETGSTFKFRRYHRFAVNLLVYHEFKEGFNWTGNELYRNLLDRLPGQLLFNEFKGASRISHNNARSTVTIDE